MKVIGTIGALLHHKSPVIWSVSPDTLVFDAIKLMSDKNIGALLVIDGDKLAGILSERDYTRKVVLRGKSSKETTVREIISSPVIYTTPLHTVEDCMRLMTESRIRHLPVLEGDKLVGIVSIGDLVNWIITAQDMALNQMEDYIAGRYPG
jgi:CBS domain-containing protein